MTKKTKRKHFFANSIHKEILLLVFFASLVPALIITVALYYLIFNITAQQLAFPEAIAYHIIPAAKKVLTLLLIGAPISLIVILVLAYKITHKIIGPFDRVVRELDETVKGKRKGRIVVRKGDKFWPLVANINKLLDKINK